MATRPAPTGMDAPPAYVSRITRVYKRDLRPVVLCLCFFSAIWCLAVGISLMRNVGDRNNTATLKTIYLALGIMYLFSAAVEIYGIGAAWTRRIRLVRLYYLGTALAAIVVTAAEVLRVVVHFTDKKQIIQSCVNEQMSLNSNPNYVPVTEDQANKLCSNSWSNSTWVDIGLLILTAIVSFLFASIAAAYYHQLLNPASTRTQSTAVTGAPSSAYTVPLAPYPPYPQSTDPYGQQQQPLPPYGFSAGAGGPPQYASQGWQGELAEDKKDPFGESGAPASGPYGARRDGNYDDTRSQDTVTLEPRRDDERV